MLLQDYISGMRCVLAIALALMPLPTIAQDCAVLLHGLARTKASMTLIEEALKLDGFFVVNQGYPSTSTTIEELSDAALPEAWQNAVTEPFILSPIPWAEFYYATI